MRSSKSSTIPLISDGSTLSETNFSKAINSFYSCSNRCCPPLKANCSISQSALDPSNFPEHLKCDPDFVAGMPSTLDLSKSSVHDGILPRMLKSTAYSIAPSQTVQRFPGWRSITQRLEACQGNKYQLQKVTVSTILFQVCCWTEELTSCRP